MSGQTPAAQELIADLTAAVEQKCQRCERHPGWLTGSSEVFESLIGNGKRLLGTSQNNNSLTGQILSIAASTVKLSAQTLLESLRRCRLAHVHTWLQKTSHPEFMSHEARIYWTPNAEQNLRNFKSPQPQPFDSPGPS